MTTSRWLVVAACLYAILDLTSAFADPLLNLAPSGFPNVNFVSNGSSPATSFTARAGRLSVTALPVSFELSALSAQRPIRGGSLTMNVALNSSGALVGGVPGDDFQLTGRVDANGDSVSAATGVLLSGEVIAFGFLESGTTDLFQFRFRITGGSLAWSFGGLDLGVQLTVESSPFANSFLVNWNGKAKGHAYGISGAIGDFVWNDTNQDGIQNEGELGIDGVTVRLKKNGVTVATTTTAVVAPGQHGYYQFIPTTVGPFTVEADAPPGFTPTPSLQERNTARDSNGSGTAVPQTNISDVNQTIDFGFYTVCHGVIGDIVWYDANGNGVQDASEPGLDGVTVKLRDLVTNTIVRTTSTTPGGSFGHGYYQFNNVCLGNYRVEVDSPRVPLHFSPTQTSPPGADRNDVSTSGRPVPEPATMWLLGLGALGIGLNARRIRAKRS